MTADDPFDLLGVDVDATPQQVTAAYRSAVKALHPDSPAGKAYPADQVADRLHALKAARDTLTDAGRREAAVARRRKAALPHEGRAPAPAMSAFDSFFDRLDRVGRARDIGVKGRRGADIEREVTVDLEDAFHGRDMRLPNGAGPCACCGATGIVTTAVERPCHVCEGMGETRRTKGLVTASMTCVVCGGKGRSRKAPCSRCGGSGQEHGAGAPFKVPAGMRDVVRLTVPGMGAPGHGGGQPGDLHVLVRVAPHPVYARSGADLAATVALSVWEASQGGTKRLRGVDGRPVDVRYPAGTCGPTTVHVPGAGMPDFPGRGDLKVTFTVTVPDATREPYRTAFARIAELEGLDATGGGTGR